MLNSGFINGIQAVMMLRFTETLHDLAVSQSPARFSILARVFEKRRRERVLVLAPDCRIDVEP